MPDKMQDLVADRLMGATIRPARNSTAKYADYANGDYPWGNSRVLQMKLAADG